jgi:hypothetical protein
MNHREEVRCHTLSSSPGFLTSSNVERMALGMSLEDTSDHICIASTCMVNAIFICCLVVESHPFPDGSLQYRFSGFASTSARDDTSRSMRRSAQCLWPTSAW